MKAHESEFSFIEKETSIEIPFFQRAYVWEQEQWEQLLEDLQESFECKKSHFLGSIVLKQLDTNTGEGTKRSLIDGQQRLTTFSILVKALYDRLEPDFRIDYTNYLFKKPTREKNPKIIHSKFDKVSFETILKAENFEDLKSLIEIKRATQGKKKGEIEDKLIACYEFFTKAFEKWDRLEIQHFFQHILISKLWVLIDLEKDEDEQKIFDSINTAGLKLTATDIIKNAIFDKAIKLKTSYEKLYEKYWQSVFEAENKAFWEEEIATGRVKRTQSEIFLHAFAIIESFFNTEKDNLEHLSAVFKDKISKFDTKDEIKTFLEKIEKYVQIYLQFPKIDKDTPLSFEEDEKRLFHILKITETNTIMPLILALKAYCDRKKLKECLYLLEIFIITRWLCAKTTKAYNKIFATCIKELNENEYKEPLKILKEQLFNEIPQIFEIKESLESKYYRLPNKKATLILFYIELFRRYKNKKMQDSIELSYQWTLEHLMPQNLTQWKNVIKDEEEAKKFVYQIGNMTLLKGALNSSIQNATWQTKLKGDESRKNCIKTCVDLLISRELFDKEQWNEDCIKERTENFIKDFFKIWDMTKLENKN